MPPILSIRFILVAAICVLPLSSGWASRMDVPFDRALERATLVVQGEIVEAWDAFPPDAAGNRSRERVYRLKVEKCFKGGLGIGDTVCFWDEHHGSTAAYILWETGRYVCFLEPDILSEYERRHLDPEGRGLLKPVRLRSDHLESYRQELQLLDLFVDNPPLDKRETYRDLLENNSGPAILAYLVKVWPQPLAQEDIALFKSKVLEKDGSELYVRLMLAELVKHPKVFADSDISALLQKGGMDFFPALRPLITGDNIKGVAPMLFAFLRDAAAADPYKPLIETLAALDPDDFRNRLVASRDFPLWKLLPCLKATAMNGSDLGLADFPEEVFSVRHNTLLRISKIREGDLFWVSFPLCYPPNCDDFSAALPLLESQLKEADSPVRRACAALFRTYGVPVKRNGSVYEPRYEDAPASCPVKLELRMDRTAYSLGEEVQFVLKETAVIDGMDFCFEGKTLTTLHFEEQWNSPEFLDQHIWDHVEMPAESFVVLKDDMSREERLTLFRKIDRPGTYRIKLKKCYVHDGGEHGLDAWTGMAFAENELTFTVVER